MGGGKTGNFGNTKGSTLDTISVFLTAASVIPGIDTFADLAAIPIDLLRGDITSAILDVFGAIPYFGEIADTTKYAKIIDKSIDTAKISNKAIDISKTVEKLSPSKLTQTHKLILSKKQYDTLVESIRKNGIIEPIKYVEYNGSKFVVDGHHRLRAAKQLKLEEIPVEKVSLPYKGYKTIDDLLWYE